MRVRILARLIVASVMKSRKACRVSSDIRAEDDSCAKQPGLTNSHITPSLSFDQLQNSSL